MVDEGSLFDKAISGLLNGITHGIEKIGETVGFKPLGKLIMDPGPNAFDFNAPSPFSESIWHTLDGLYLNMSLVAAGLFMAVILSTAFKFMKSSMNPAAREEAVESMWRWLGCAVFIAAAPMVVRCVFLLNNALVGAIGSTAFEAFSPESFSVPATGHVITTALVHLLFIVQWFRVNIIFLIRDWVIFVMYAFTPLVAILWAFKKDVLAYSVWLGEVLSNGFLQTAYCIVLTVLIALIPADPAFGWFYQLVGVYMLVSLAGMLRNGLQGLWTRWAGIEEEGLAGGFVGFLGGMLGTAGVRSLGRVFESRTSENPKRFDTPRSGGETPENSGNYAAGEVQASSGEPRFYSTLASGTSGLKNVPFPVGNKPAAESLPFGNVEKNANSASGEESLPFGNIEKNSNADSAGNSEELPKFSEANKQIKEEYRKNKSFKKPDPPHAYQSGAFVKAANRARRVYTAADVVTRAALYPVLSSFRGGKQIADAAGYAVGKTLQLPVLTVGHLVDTVKEANEHGVSLGEAVYANVPEGTPVKRRPVKIAGALATEWLNPNWTPTIASWQLNRNFDNQLNRKI